MVSKSSPTNEYVCERYQWMRNKQGGQHFGNREEIRILTEPAFREHIQPRLMRPRTTFSRYRAAYPAVTHYSVIANGNNPAWRFVGAGTLAELRPTSSARQWALRVDDFNSPQAIEWSKTPDDKRAPVSAPASVL